MEQTADLLFQKCLSELEGAYDSGELRSVVSILLEDMFEITRMDMAMRKIVSVDYSQLQEALEKIKAHVPIQQVVGKAHFYGRKFFVSPETLIPRPETEELVSWIIEENKISNPKIWDIGTGTGCIAISLDAEITGAETYATDVSKGALLIAKSNNERSKTNVTFQLSDVLKDVVQFDQLDIIVSNPPYIPTLDKADMHANVLKHEPELALFVPDNDPMLFYRRIGGVGLTALKTGGKLYFEVHERLARETLQLLLDMGYSDGEIRTDLQGKERMVRVRIS